ncbi:MAG: cell division protein FtsQ/DivIB [Pseudomonadota bacterium]|nr:cell division protein FtsQ/DivIB [Pseudomonadota bacterium]
MWDRPRELNAAAMVLAAIAALMLAYGALSWVARRPAFEFREIVIQPPLSRVNAAHLEALIRDELKGTFFTMNLDRARVAITGEPWVRRASLRRQWPHRLEVTIEEHVPLARWNDAGLVNVQGEVFDARYVEPLPRFSGPEGSALELTRRYQDWGIAIAPLKLTIDEVRASARGGWHLRLIAPTGPLDVELGRDDPSAAVARFTDTYERTLGVLARSGTRVEQVDLRYRNGFAARVPAFRERPPKKTA